MFRKVTIVAIVALLTQTLAAAKLSNNDDILYGTNADCNACAKCYRDDKGTSSLDSTCGEVTTLSPSRRVYIQLTRPCSLDLLLAYRRTLA